MALIGWTGRKGVRQSQSLIARGDEETKEANGKANTSLAAASSQDARCDVWFRFTTEGPTTTVRRYHLLPSLEVEVWWGQGRHDRSLTRDQSPAPPARLGVADEGMGRLWPETSTLRITRTKIR